MTFGALAAGPPAAAAPYALDAGYGVGGFAQLGRPTAPDLELFDARPRAGGGAFLLGHTQVERADGAVVELAADGKQAAAHTIALLSETIASDAWRDSHGRLVVTGVTLVRGTSMKAFVARLRADGTLDPGYGTGGRLVLPDDLPDCHSASVARRPSGATVSCADQRLIALDEDGRIDRGWGEQGTATSPVRGSSTVAGAAGTVLRAGEQFDECRILRLTATGAPDASFGGDGIVEVPLGACSAQLLVSADGTLLVHNGTEVMRLAADGSPATSFGTGGRARPFPHRSFFRLTKDSLERPVAYTSGSDFGLSIARLTTAGQPDATFGAGGYVDLLDPMPSARVVPTRDGRLLVARQRANGASYVDVRELRQDGSTEPSFGGAVGVPRPASGYVGALAAGADGSAFMGDIAWTAAGGEAHVRRLTAAGVPDAAFAGGSRIVASGPLNEITLPPTVAPRASGVVYGITTLPPASPYDTRVRALGPDGEIDADYGDEGTATPTDASGRPLLIIGARSDGDATLVVGVNGVTANETVLVRLRGDGERDPDFGVDGRVVLAGITPETLRRAPGGKIIVASFVAGEVRVHRLLANGLADPTWTVRAFAAQVPSRLTLDQGERVLLGFRAGESADSHVVRLRDDGTVDASFGDQGIARVAGRTVTGLAAGDGERILVSANQPSAPATV
ncbi:MAG TPA: hypothetical protein VFZ89_06900, partial [Solirubrobacteraceae bacterium]